MINMLLQYIVSKYTKNIEVLKKQKIDLILENKIVNDALSFV